MTDADVSARIDRLERLAHWEDLETRIARLERLATVAGIAIAIGVGVAVGAYVQGAVQSQPSGWPAILATLAAIGMTVLLQLKLIRLDALDHGECGNRISDFLALSRSGSNDAKLRRPARACRRFPHGVGQRNQKQGCEFLGATGKDRWNPDLALSFYLHEYARD